MLVGMPAGLVLSHDALQTQLARRQRGYGRSPRQQLEQDIAVITSGVRHGTTLGSPIALRIRNDDHRNWDAAMAVWPTHEQQGNWRDRPTALVRPGHADLGGMARGAFSELRPVLERASARETAARVAIGALAQQLLESLGVFVRAHVVQVGDVQTTGDIDHTTVDWSSRESSSMGCLDVDIDHAMMAAVDEARAARDTLGGVIEIIVLGLPPGLGGYATSAERIDGRLAGAAMSVQAMKAVEFGAGMRVASARGSDLHDAMHVAGEGVPDQGMGVGRLTNNAGGVEGGMTNGAPLVMRVAMKPLPTLMQPLASVDLATGERAQAHAERSDTCAVPAAAVVLEAAIAFEIACVIREQFGMSAMVDLTAAWGAYCDRVAYPRSS